MTREKKKAWYSAGLLTMIFATLLLASAALTVIFAGDTAFPVQVFGTAALDDVAPEPLSIRDSRTGEVLHGRLADFAIPAVPLEDFSAFLAGPPRDTELENARLLATEGQWVAAIDAYDRIVEARPTQTELAIERARVLSWSGDAVGAARAIEAIAERRPGDAALRIEAARYYWWAGQPERSDELLSEARAIGTDDPELGELLPQVRAAFTPDVEAARRWIREEDGWENRAALARAYLSDQRWIAATGEYARAVAFRGAPDSLYLEMAAAATAGDSIALGIEALESYLAWHPEATDVRLQLARAHSWREDYDAALVEYERYLSAVDDRTARFEMAQILAWTEQNDAAARQLRRVALADPLHGPTYRLLGDLARYEGDYELAIANYRYASDLMPADRELRSVLGETEAEYVRIRRAAMPLPLGACTLAFDTFRDSEGFQWVSTAATRTWRMDWGAVAVTAQQNLPGGESSFAPGRRMGGIGGAVSLFLPVSETASIDLLAGTSDYGDFGSYARARIGYENRDVAGATVRASYTRGPAVQRAATIAALQANTTTDLLQLTASREFGAWSGWSSIEAERLQSDFGGSYRYAASVAATRRLSDVFTVTAGLSAITASGPSPRMPDGRALYWTPELYVASTLGLAFEKPYGGNWLVGGGVTPGWAYVRERAGGDRRFGSNYVPTIGVDLQVGYLIDDWEIRGVMNWGGSVDAGGYRSSNFSVQGSYRLGEP